MTADNIEAILQRTIRIETKLTRFLTGEPGCVTNATIEVTHTKQGWEIEVNTMSVTLHALRRAAHEAGMPDGEEALVRERGEDRMLIVVI